MHRPSADLAEQPTRGQGSEYPPAYRGFFACFNAQRFFEAHDVLEVLWLAERGQPDADFYKALIQLAGAFVHLQKDRLRPAAALLQLSRGYFARYPTRHLGLNVAGVLALTADWHGELVAGAFAANPLRAHPAPRLTLDPSWTEPAVSPAPCSR